MADNEDYDNEDYESNSTYEGENQIIENMFEKKTLKEHVEDQIKRSPWWLISLVAHGLVIYLLTLIVLFTMPEETEEILIETEIVEQEPEKEVEELKEIFEEKEVQVENTEVTEVEEVEEIEEVEVETEVEVDAFVEESDVAEVSLDLADTPDVGMGALGEIGVGATGGGAGGALGGRSSKGSRKAAVKRGGGNAGVIGTVERALRYLARTQDESGCWIPANHEGKAGAHVVTSMTGVSMLCFLGAGHSEIAGKYRGVVKKATEWLRNSQKENGLYSANMYAHGMAALAMTEAYAMGMRSKTKESAQKAVDACFNAQNSHGGWNYSDLNGKTGRSDLSVAGWQMMAIKSAKIGKLKIDEAKTKKGLHSFAKATLGDYNLMGYAAKGGDDWAGAGGNPRMAVIGMCIKQFFGMPKKHDELTMPANWLLTKGHIPSPNAGNDKTKKGANSYYHMYYGALVMFQMGGKYWKAWREQMLAYLPPTQNKNGGPLDGSWAPALGDGVHGGETIGRIGVTAFYCLAMEVFWRYMPLYK